MIRAAYFALAAIALAMGLPGPLAAKGGNCKNCDLPPTCRGSGSGQAKNCIDLQIESDIQFGRLVLIGDGVGQVLIDLDTGRKVITGRIGDLGGMAFEGRARIQGSPSSPVRIDFPPSITMSDGAGATATLRDFATNLPPIAYLDGNGQLEFRFTGKLYTNSPIGGKMRGRIPISVDYD